MKHRNLLLFVTTALTLLFLVGCKAGYPGADVNAGSPSTTGPASTTAPELISKEEAISIALTHAGFTQEQVTRLRTEFDYDDGVPEYEVDFYADGTEYDYEIHARTGEIRRWDKDMEIVPDPTQSTKSTEVAPAISTQPAVTLTEEDALQVALDHAGVTQDQISGLKTKLDYDDGVPEYEIDFRVGTTEYEYEINAETGKIRSWDKDLYD